MWPPSGLVIYVRDLALELKRRGHVPTVFSSTHGPVVKELRDAGIEVMDQVQGLPQPDIIHANHRAPFLIAARRWPKVPAIYVCHAYDARQEVPPLHPSIRRYFGVSTACLRRLADAGVPESAASLSLNSVDTTRFQPREPLPSRPRRALVFSNYASPRTHLPAVLEACYQAGIEVDVVGEGVDNIATSPERLLPLYDLVFAKAKAAMEAMAVGNAVVLCDQTGLGPMVTSTAFDELRPLNFGFEALRGPLERGPLLREMARYDPADATHVRDLIRSTASLTGAVQQLTRTYEEVVAEQPSWRVSPSDSPVRRPPLLGRSVLLRLFWRWCRIPRGRREVIKGLPGFPGLIAALRRLG